MLSKFLARHGFGRLAYNTVLGTVWQFARIGAQALWLVVIAHALGPFGYGIFAGTAGLAITLSALSGLGTGMVMLQRVSSDRSSLGSQLRKAVTVTAASGTALAIIFVAIANIVLNRKAPTATLVALGFSELVFFPLVYVASYAFQSHERLGWSGALPAMLSSSRLLAVIAFAVSGLPATVDTYAWFHFAASGIAAATSLRMVDLLLRPSTSRYSLDFAEIRAGLGFSAATLTSNAVSELDKTLALRLAGGEVAGIYSAAYRLASITTLPVTSMILAAQPRLFRAAGQSRNESVPLVRRLLLVTASYGVAASIALLGLSGILPLLLGASFAPASREVLLLALLPPLYSLRVVGSTILLTDNRQVLRIMIEGIGIILLVVMGVLWIPRYGPAGIALTVTASEAFLATCTWSIVRTTHSARARK